MPPIVWLRPAGRKGPKQEGRLFDDENGIQQLVHHGFEHAVLSPVHLLGLRRFHVQARDKRPRPERGVFEREAHGHQPARHARPADLGKAKSGGELRVGVALEQLDAWRRVGRPMKPAGAPPCWDGCRDTTPLSR